MNKKNMCKFCEENYEINTIVGERQVIISLDEKQKDFVKIKLPFVGDGEITKPIQINFCPFCGKRLVNLKGFTKNYEVLEPYTTEINWDNNEVWINLHQEQKKVVITKSVSESISRDFELLKLTGKI